MKTEPVYRRGDVVLVRFPFITDFSRTKMRPAVVIQNDVGNRYSPNLIVAAVSSQVPDKPYPTICIIPHNSAAAQAAGLDRDSVVLGQVILTLPQQAVVQTLGALDASTMAAVDVALRVSISL